MKPLGTRTGILAVVAGTVLLFTMSLAIGVESGAFTGAWRDWRAGVPFQESVNLQILFMHRLPRTLVAALAGAGLAVAGCAFQALLRNPLATPYTLGVASAGALGAWTAVILVGRSPEGLPAQIEGALNGVGLSLRQFGAFTLAALDMAFIYVLATRRARMSPAVLLLAGVTLGMMANAGIVLMRYLASPELLVSMERWLMGGVAVIGYGEVMRLAIGIVPCALVLLYYAGQYDQVGFSPELAEGRGVNVTALQRGTFIVGSLMTAIIVSEVGPIGFVGLVVPHAVRACVGANHRLLMPLSIVAGAGFLCFCDIVTRLLFVQETPIGIVSSFIGVPVFIALMLRRGFTDWER